MQPAINHRYSFMRLAPVTPHLQHINLPRLILPPRIPRNHLLAFFPHICHHLRHKTGIGKLHLIRPDMQIGHIFKRLAHFIHQELQNSHSFLTLHIMAERLPESSTVSRHIHLRYQHHPVGLTKSHQLLCLLKCIILSGIPPEIHTVIQHRKHPAFQAPCQILRQMPMKHIDFITGQFRNLMLQLLYRQIPPPHIVHKPSDAERRPICHLTPRQILLFARLFNHLPQRLKSPISSSVCHRLYPYPLTVHMQTISLLRIQTYPRQRIHRHNFHLPGSSRPYLTLHLLQPLQQLLPTQLHLLQLHGIQRKLPGSPFHLLRLRKQNRRSCHLHITAEQNK